VGAGQGRVAYGFGVCEANLRCLAAKPKTYGLLASQLSLVATSEISLRRFLWFFLLRLLCQKKEHRGKN